MTFIENDVKKPDLFNEEFILDSFNNLIQTSELKVFGLTGGWGIGKSTFIQMWENGFVDSEHFHVIHIDAFSKDYVNDPFIMLYGAFNQLVKGNSSFEKKLKDASVEALKIAGKSLLNITISKLGIKNEDLKELISGSSNAFYEKMIEDYNQQEEKYSELKAILKSIVKSYGKKIIIVIDELDRCRPDFALETFEKIKHLFNVEDVKYILVYNKDAMSSIVSAKYGFDDKKMNESYVRKFVDYEFELQLNFLGCLSNYLGYVANDLQGSLPSEVCKAMRDWSSKAEKIAIKYNMLSLRNIVKVFSTYKKIGRQGFNENHELSATLMFLKNIDRTEYDGIIAFLKSGNNFTEDSNVSKDNFLEIAKITYGNTDVKYAFKDFYDSYQYYPDLFN